MSRAEVSKVVGMAVTDSNFRKALLEDPAKTLKKFHLTDEERKAIEAINTQALEEFVNSLSSRGSNLVAHDAWNPDADKDRPVT